MSEKKKDDFPVSTIRICINRLGGNEQISGFFHGIALKEKVLFSGINDFIVKVDKAYNSIGRPQAFQVMRSFQNDEQYNSYVGNPKRYFSSLEIRANLGTVKTFDLIMTSRKNAEWQGLLKDVDGKIVFNFVTTMECVNYLVQDV